MWSSFPPTNRTDYFPFYIVFSQISLVLSILLRAIEHTLFMYEALGLISRTKTKKRFFIPFQSPYTYTARIINYNHIIVSALALSIFFFKSMFGSTCKATVYLRLCPATSPGGMFTNSILTFLTPFDMPVTFDSSILGDWIVPTMPVGSFGLWVLVVSC